MRPGGSYRGMTGHASLWWARRFMTRLCRQFFTAAIETMLIVVGA